MNYDVRILDEVNRYRRSHYEMFQRYPGVAVINLAKATRLAVELEDMLVFRSDRFASKKTTAEEYLKAMKKGELRLYGMKIEVIDDAS